MRRKGGWEGRERENINIRQESFIIIEIFSIKLKLIISDFILFKLNKLHK